MTKKIISDRLLTIANMIDDSSNVFDVGCDHGLLDIYITLNKKNVKTIATDLRQSALSQAQNNISTYDLNNKIETRISNGISAMRKSDNIDTIVLAGMGYQTIISILKENICKLNNIKNIVIQSNTKVYKIREIISELGFYIEKEALVKDKNKIYVVIKFKRGYKRYSKVQLFMGPCLLKNKNSLFYEYYSLFLEKKINILNNIPDDNSDIRNTIEQEINMIKKEIL